MWLWKNFSLPGSRVQIGARQSPYRNVQSLLVCPLEDGERTGAVLRGQEAAPTKKSALCGPQTQC